MEKKMIVLHLIDSLKSGGKERQLLNFLQTTSTDGIYYLLVADSEIQLSNVYNTKVKVQIIPYNRKSVNFQLFLFKFLKDNNIQIIHSWDALSTVTCIIPAKLRGTRIINGSIRGSAKVKTFSKRYFLERINFLLSDINVANSFAGLRAISRTGKKYKCIHNGFVPREIQRTIPEIKEELGVGECILVGMVASFRSGKDYFTFFESALELIRGNDNICFIAIGGGPLLSQYLDKYGSLSKKIKILGFKSNPSEYINAFDIGVLLSYECAEHGEGISNSIMEYMSFGLPVVATKSGGNGEIVSDGQTGILISEKNATEFISSIRTLINDREKMSLFGSQGKKRLLTDFSVEKMVKSTIEIYDSLLKRTV